MLDIDGAPFTRLSAGSLALLGGMGDETARPCPDRLYMETIAFGAGDPRSRVQCSTNKASSASCCIPRSHHLGIDGERCAPRRRYARAYNRWIADFCRDSTVRLIAIAHISLTDADLAATELARAVARWVQGAMVFSLHVDAAPARAFVLRRALESCCRSRDTGRHPSELRARLLQHALSLSRSLEHAWCRRARRRVHGQCVGASGDDDGVLVVLRVFDFRTVPQALRRRARIRRRLDRVVPRPYGCARGRDVVSPQHAHDAPPSEYFRTNCFISCAPTNCGATDLDHVGADRFIWATAFPLPITPRLAGAVEKSSVRSHIQRARVLGRNVAELYTPLQASRAPL